MYVRDFDCKLVLVSRRDQNQSLRWVSHISRRGFLDLPMNGYMRMIAKIQQIKLVVLTIIIYIAPYIDQDIFLF